MMYIEQPSKIKQIIHYLFSILFIIGICSCDLGDGTDEKVYYDTFANVSFVCQSETTTPEIRDYPLSDLYNESTMEGFPKVVEEDSYKYVIVKASKKLEIEEIALWMESDEYTGVVCLDFYVVDTYPTTFFGDKLIGKEAGKYKAIIQSVSGGKIVTTYQYLYLDGFGTVYDGDGHTSTYTKKIEGGEIFVTFNFTYDVNEFHYNYDYTCEFSNDYSVFLLHGRDKINNYDLPVDRYVYEKEYSDTPEANIKDFYGSTSFRLDIGKWNSFLFNKWEKDGNRINKVLLNEGDCFVIKIVNNCQGGFRRGVEKISFSANNYLIKYTFAE